MRRPRFSDSTSCLALFGFLAARTRIEEIKLAKRFDVAYQEYARQVVVSVTMQVVSGPGIQRLITTFEKTAVLIQSEPELVAAPRFATP